MLFTSYEFLGFLLLLFFLYYVIPKKLQWKLLLFASYLFYAMAGVKYLFYIGITTLSTYFICRKIENIGEIQKAYIKSKKEALTREEKKAYKASMKKKQWHWLLVCLIFNFGILAVCKYANFTISNVNYLLQRLGTDTALPFLSIALPLGISYYTFQMMGYAIDIYRAKYPAEKNLGKLALFAAFFPQLMQGPISRFDDLSKTLFSAHTFDKKQVSFGLQRILWGFFKKLVIADRILPAVTTIIKDPVTYQGIYVLVGMLFYALELYADFTGGIDIVIGIAEVLGIRVKENFERPYFSKSIKEYWNRWHISLGSWFTEYIFYPVSVCQPMLKLSKFSRNHFGDAIGKRIPVYLATILVWFTTGIWHGAAWNFVVWGLMNCLVLLISQELQPFYHWFHGKFHVEGKLPFRMFQVVRTVLLMSSIRMFDCYRDVPTTFHMFFNLLTHFNWTELGNGELLKLGISAADYGILAIGLLILFCVSLSGRNGSVREKIASKPAMVRFVIWYGLFLIVLILGAYGEGYDASQFIYNQF